MAEVNQGFEAALRRGREFGAAGDWAKALTEFIRAAQITPADITARYHLALALFKLEQFDQAIGQFQGIVRNQPQHTDAWQRLAEIQHKTGRTPEAIQTYQRIKEIHQKADRQREMADILREMIKTDPGQVEAYRELMDIAKARGDRKTAAGLALGLGQYFQSQGRTADALSAANEALMFQPGWAEAAAFKSQLDTPSLSDLPPLPDFEMPSLPSIPAALPDPVASSPNGSSDSMVATMSQTEYTIQQLINSAEESLARGDTGPALRNYEMAVEAGVNRADVFYSIGQLYAQSNQTDRAVDYLRRATSDPEYAASAFFSIGQVYSDAGRLDEAANAYQDALNLIDLQTIGKDEVDELIDMYDMLGEVLLRQTKESEAAELYGKLANFINTKNFRTEKSSLVLIRSRELSEKVATAGTGAATAASESPLAAFGEDDHSLITSSIRFGGEDAASPENPAIGEVRTGTGLPPIGSFSGAARPTSVASSGPQFHARFPSKLVEMDNSAYVAPYLQAAEEFMRSERWIAAIDACQEMVRYYPDYIPAQVILAEVNVAQGRLEQARIKYQFVVDLYQLRQEPLKSVECYKRLGEISPDNMGLRSKLAKLLLQYNQKEDAAELMLSTIANYVRSGQLERALEECKNLRQLAPNSASVRVQYAELLNRLDRQAEALPELRRALEIDSNNLRALALLNITSFLLGDNNLKWGSFQTVVERGRLRPENLREMLEEYRQASMLSSHAGLAYALGCLYLENKQFDQAGRAFDQALSSETRADYEPLIYWALGQAYVEQHQPAPAVAQLSQVANSIEQADPSRYASSASAYGVLPSQVQLYRKLSQAFQLQGETGQAIKALKTVKKLLPYNREVHAELAELYFNQGQLNEALTELGELVAHYEETGKVEPMVDVLREMAKLAPNNMGVREKLSQVYLKRGHIDDGLKELDELAELQRKNGRLKDAVRTLQQAAETHFMMGKMEAAYNLYDRIVRISPGDVEARQQLVNRHLMSGRFADAVEEQRTIAQICLQQNNTEGAIAALHQVIGLARDDTRAYFQLATVLASTNEHFQSYRLYERILRLEPGNEKARNLMEQAQRRAVEAGQMKVESK